MDLQSRIEALERKNVRLTRITAALGLCLAGVLLMAAVPKNYGDLECRSLKVADPRSNAVIEIKSVERDVGAERNMGVIVTADGQKVASFGNRESRGGLTVKSASHSMLISPHSIESVAGETSRAMFGEFNGQGYISVLDDTGTPSVVTLGGIKGVPGFISIAQPGATVQNLSNTKREGAILTAKALMLSDKNGTTRNAVAIDPDTGVPSVLLFDASGREKKRLE